jgi:phosphate transport system protein
MERHFDISLRSLKERLLAMAGFVEAAIEAATIGMQNRDQEKFEEVYELEKKINDAHLAVDAACVKLLALQQPFATDLRLIVAIIKINTDLERMGDQAVNIAHNAEIYLKAAPLKPLVDLPRMFDEVRLMVRAAFDAFVRRDEPTAREVLVRDDNVDELKRKIFDDVVDHMKKNPDKIDAGLALILIARNLERVGDHATNIAEDVIYAVSGDDIRHKKRTP